MFQYAALGGSIQALRPHAHRRIIAPFNLWIIRDLYHSTHGLDLIWRWKLCYCPSDAVLQSDFSRCFFPFSPLLDENISAIWCHIDAPYGSTQTAYSAMVQTHRDSMSPHTVSVHKEKICKSNIRVFSFSFFSLWPWFCVIIPCLLQPQKYGRPQVGRCIFRVYIDWSTVTLKPPIAIGEVGNIDYLMAMVPVIR